MFGKIEVVEYLHEDCLVRNALIVDPPQSDFATVVRDRSHRCEGLQLVEIKNAWISFEGVSNPELLWEEHST